MLELWWYPVLFTTGLAAGFVDAVVGGGGLITLPVLLNLGLDPVHALGTNKLQASFGSGSAAWHYGRAGLIDLRACGWGVGFTLAGSALGSVLARHLDPDLLRKVIPWLLIVIALYLLLRPRFGDVEARARWSPGTFYPVLGLTLGFYDGFFGPGTGTFWAMAFVLGLGFNLTRATAHTKVMNFASNIASLAVFLIPGQVYVGAGLTMGLGQLVGARLGAGTVIRRGVGFIRPIFIGVVLAISGRLLYKAFVAS